MQVSCIILCADGSLNQEGFVAHIPGVIDTQQSDLAGRQLGTRTRVKGDLLPYVGDDLLEDEGGDKAASEAVRDAMEARSCLCSCLGDCKHGHHVIPRDQLRVPQECRFSILTKYIDVARPSKTTLHNWDQGAVDDIRNVDKQGMHWF